MTKPDKPYHCSSGYPRVGVYLSTGDVTLDTVDDDRCLTPEETRSLIEDLQAALKEIERD